MKKILIILAALSMAACAGKGNYGGSVDKNVRNYQALMEADAVKRVEFYCNFEKIVEGDMLQFGDYCQRAANSDYVSYFTSFDVQSSNIYTDHLIQTINMVASENTPGQLRYYQIFSGNNFDRLTRYDIENKGITSFAVKNGGNYHIVISKEDLLARMNIYPELSILSVTQKDATRTPQVINEYEVKYRIAPYVFSVEYADAETARLLGLPDYLSLAGRLDSAKIAQLNNYSTALARYWENPGNYRYSANSATVMDYAMPQLMKGKENMPSELNLRVTPPMQGEGLLNDYLPGYELVQIAITYSQGAQEMLLRSYNRDEIARILISYENDALVYSTDADKDGLAVKFIYKAKAPRNPNADKLTFEYLGIGYIYSDIAATIESKLYIERFYQLENLPRVCVDERAFIAEFTAAGKSRTEAEAVLNRLDQAPMALCTPTQKSMGALLHTIVD